MGKLNPTISKETNGNLTLHWTSDPTAKSYLITTPSGSATAGAQRTSSNLGKHDSITVTVASLYAQAAESASYPNVTPPPPVLTPHAPIDTSNQNNQTYSSLDIEVPPNWTDINVAPLYIHGPCTNLDFKTMKLTGGFNGIKLYTSTWGAVKNITLDGIEVFGVGGDCLHIDGASGMHIDNCHFHDPLLTGSGAPPPVDQEHHDAIQIESGENIYIGPGCLFSWPITPRRDGTQNGGGGGFFINATNQGGRPLRNITIDRVQIHQWWGGRAMQMFCSGTIISPDIVDCGNGTNSPPITLSRPQDNGKIVLQPAATGLWSGGVVKRSDVYLNDFSGGGWPDYVTVLS